MNRFLQFLMFFSHVLWLHLPSSLLYLSFSQNVLARLSLDLSEFCSSCFPLACFSLSLGLWSVNVCHIFHLKRHLFDYKSKLYTSHKWWCLVHNIFCDKFECGSAVPRCLPPDHQNPTEARSFRDRDPWILNKLSEEQHILLKEYIGIVCRKLGRFSWKFRCIFIVDLNKYLELL